MPIVKVGEKKIKFPDGMSNDAISEALQKQFASADVPESSFYDNAVDAAGNVLAGAVRGAGSIGATILTPYDLVAGNTDSIGNPERRQAIDAALETLGADTDSVAYKGGKLAGEIAGTAGIGGALAKGAQVIKAPEMLVSALSSGGFKLSTPSATTAFGKGVEWLSRIAGGGAVGGTQALAINPEDADTGAVIGAATPGAVKVVGEAGKLLNKGASSFIKNTIGSLTGTSPETVGAAFQAGKRGAVEFLDNMRGKADFGDVVDAAKQGLSNMRDSRAAVYRSGMIDIKADKTVLDFKQVDKALNDIVGSGSFKGVAIRKKAAETVDDLKDVVEQWRALPPDDFHTPEGFDALKQAIGDIRDSTQFGTGARRSASMLYNAVKREINKQAPTYSKVMKDYETASKTIEEISKALSLGEKTSKDTAIRKLQSLMRNNAQSNFGNRLNLASQLEQQGGVNLTDAIAGQSMSTALPRGMAGAIEKAGAIPAAAIKPSILLAAPFTSPRLMGESAYALGRMSGASGKSAQAVNALLPNIQRQKLLNALYATPVPISLTALEAQQ